MFSDNKWGPFPRSFEIFAMSLTIADWGTVVYGPCEGPMKHSDPIASHVGDKGEGGRKIGVLQTNTISQSFKLPYKYLPLVGV